MADHHIDVTDQKALRRRSVESAPGADHATPVHPLLRLQSQVGNAQIARLLAQREAEEDEVAAKHDPSIQREGDEDEVAAKHDEHVGIEGGPVPPDTQQRIQAARGGGSSLDGGTRSTMEANFGTSFGDVRVHQDAESDTLNRRLTAKAFTTGSDIFLRSDSSTSDSHLMAHELTHVVQQRSMSGGGGMSVGAAGDPHEHHADSVADAVTSQAPAAVAAKHDPSVQRAEEDEEVAAEHDLSLQREAEEDEVAAKHDQSIQREAEDEEVAAKHDQSVQRAEEEEEVAAKHDPSIQREGEDDEQ
jgi:hypothetical protein